MNKIAEIFSSLDYGPAPESPEPALAWLASKGGKFGHFINGKWTKPGRVFASDNPATGRKLADITDGTAADVDKAVKAARAAFPAWSALSGYERGKYLYPAELGKPETLNVMRNQPALETDTAAARVKVAPMDTNTRPATAARPMVH